MSVASAGRVGEDAPEACGEACAAPPAAHAPSLRRSFSWVLLGDLVYAGCSWAMIVVLAKLGTPEMLGQFALGVAINAPVWMFATLQLRALQATDAANGAGFAAYFTLRLLLTGLALGVVFGIVAWSGYSTEAKAVIVGVTLFRMVELVSDIFHGELQRRGTMQWIGVSVALKGLLGVAILALGVWQTGRLAPACAVVAVAWLLVFLAVDVPSVGRGLPASRSTLALCWDRRRLGRLLLQALPLGLVAMLIALTMSLPRYYLEYHAGDAALGVFSALAALAQASTLPAAALGSTASARLGLCWAARDVQGTRRLLTQLLGLAALFGLMNLAVVWLGGRILLTLFYSPEYARHHEELRWLMLAAVGTNLCFILNWAVVAARYLRIQVPFQAALVLVAMLACAALIPLFGLRGAVLSVGLTTACTVLGNALLVWHAVRSLRAEAG